MEETKEKPQTKKEAKQKKEKKKKLPLKRSFQNNVFALNLVRKTDTLYFVIFFLTTPIYAVFNFLSGSYLLRVIVNDIGEGKNTGNVLKYVIILSVSATVFYILHSLYQNTYSITARRKVIAAIEKMIFCKAAETDLECYETPSFYDKYLKAIGEARDRVFKVMNTLDNLLWRIIELSLNSFLLFLIDPVLILFGLFPLLLGILNRRLNIVKHDFFEAIKPVDRKNAYVKRTFYLNDYAKEMRLGGMVGRMMRDLKENYGEFRKILGKYGIKRALLEYARNIGLEVITVLGAMLYAAYKTLVVQDMSIGDCIVIFGSISEVSYCLNALVQNIAEFGEHALFLDDVRYLLEYKPKIKKNENGIKAHGGDICFENVSFCYEGSEKETLHNVSLSVKNGERIAVVGKNGAGKTTLIKLLLHLYEPTSGKITLDGRDISEYSLSSYRESFSTVFQDFRMFSLSVEDNILLRPHRDWDEEKVTRALYESGASERIAKLPSGIKTTLTKEFDEDGAVLSIGEQQKVCLARIFSDSSPCVVLDEPSSALDPIAEYKMFENMISATVGRSVIFISHRLSSAVLADRVYLMDGGTVTECGTHHELMEKNGDYAEMFRRQAQNYLGEEEAE